MAARAVLLIDAAVSPRDGKDGSVGLGLFAGRGLGSHSRHRRGLGTSGTCTTVTHA
jgi:hypothetical protein